MTDAPACLLTEGSGALLQPPVVQQYSRLQFFSMAAIIDEIITKLEERASVYMTIDAYISRQPAERQELLKALHAVISANDGSVRAAVGPMMGIDMIRYHAPGIFKYGLAGVKNHMSLHVMPIYGSPKLYEKYKNLMPRAKFQKGCINFKSAEDVPLATVTSLIRDCSTIDLLKIKEEYMKSKKK